MGVMKGGHMVEEIHYLTIASASERTKLRSENGQHERKRFSRDKMCENCSREEKALVTSALS
jgi:hypothetical protein